MGHLMEFRLPELGEGIYEAELVDWHVQPGDTVKRGQSLAEVMTDKASMEVPSPFAGTIASLEAQPGQEIKVGEVVLNYRSRDESEAEIMERGNGESTAEQAVEPEREPAQAVAAGVESPRASVPAPAHRSEAPSSLHSAAALPKAAPSVRRMARSLGVELARVRGSGPGGRILIDDLTDHLRAVRSEEKPRASQPRPDYGTPGTRVPLRGVRRKIAEQMVRSKHTVPHYTYIDEGDVSDLVRLRDALRDRFADAGLRLTYLPFFVKAVVAGLKEVPIVNATLDDEAGEIALHGEYHVGIATATPQGLIVPVVRDADKKDIPTLAREIERLTADARAGKSRLEDLRGGTITVTSFGGIGGLIATPILNHPEAAIVGFGKIVKRPVFDDAGNVRPADMLYLSISLDHRVVDGAVGAVFGNAVIRALQSPATLLLPECLK